VAGDDRSGVADGAGEKGEGVTAYASLIGDVVASVGCVGRRVVGIQGPTDALNYRVARGLKYGAAGVDRVNRMFHGRRALGPSAAESLSLDGAGSGGSVLLTDALGVTVVFAAVLVFAIRATDRALTIGNATNPWAPWLGGGDDQVRVGRSAFHVRMDPAGWAVSAGAANLRVANTEAGATNYDIVVIGRT